MLASLYARRLFKWPRWHMHRAALCRMYVCIDAMGRGDEGMFLFISWWRGGTGATNGVGEGDEGGG